MDLVKKLLTQLSTTLTENETLQAAMGDTVRLYITWAKPDAVFPYLVHRLDLVNLTDWSPVRTGIYLIDIWSQEDTPVELLAIRSQIITLIDELYYGAVDEHDGAWFWLQSDMFVPEPEEGIWHYNISFNIKYLKEADVASRLRR